MTDAMVSATIDVRNISMTFRSKRETVKVLSGIDMNFHPGEFVSVIGPSGSGKSTLFNVLAGLDAPSGGHIEMSGVDVTGTTGIFAYMPQKDLLMPWLRVIDNASVGLRVQGMGKNEARERAAELFEVFGLSGTEMRWPAQLSGGMRQRVALLRTVLQGRPALLLDEPFGALDSLTRTEMQEWLLEVWGKFQWTVVLITHDIREAVLLSDRVYVLSPRPAHVQSEHVITLDRPRTVEMFAEPEAVRLESELLRGLEQHRERRA